ncbi:hypothetical protein [Mycobacterium adipatum]|uniref:hypothetical protein n=1 Tax=Mycobacterium adipatum TaxID=1682113 RepID=UPI0012E928AB|nr:hypothetical protein [Mycobacterium adipatum]
MSTGVPSRQRANAGLDQNSDSLQIIFREGTPARDPQVLIIARFFLPKHLGNRVAQQLDHYDGDESPLLSPPGFGVGLV